jgi:hypothetical protein
MQDDLTAHAANLWRRELERARGSPQAVRLADKQRLGVVKEHRPISAGSPGDAGCGHRNGHAAHLALHGHLAQRVLRLAVLSGRCCHRFAALHGLGHCAARVGCHGLHGTLSGRAASCQPREGQHRAKPQDEQGTQDFHDGKYSSALNSAYSPKFPANPA